MPLTVAIVGRPNVGKSTLFNRLAGKRLAIVDDTPGVTRDRATAQNNVQGLDLRLIDTAGFDEGAPESLTARMAVQTRTAILDADVCLFVIDARAGLTAGDRIVADALRKSGKPVIVAANKCESAASDAGAMEAYDLGFGEPCGGIGRARSRRWRIVRRAGALCGAPIVGRDGRGARSFRSRDPATASRHCRTAQCRQIEPAQSSDR